jgi:hypothetical protein
MSDKLSHDEVCRRGGLSKSRVKLEAVARNLAKAKSVLAQKRTARAAKEPGLAQ